MELYASLRRHNNVVKYLVKFGTDINKEDNYCYLFPWNLMKML